MTLFDLLYYLIVSSFDNQKEGTKIRKGEVGVVKLEVRKLVKFSKLYNVVMTLFHLLYCLIVSSFDNQKDVTKVRKYGRLVW